MPRIIRAIVGLVLAIPAGWGTFAPEDEPASPRSMLLGGVSYQARQELVRQGDKAVIRTSVLAFEPGTDKSRWSVNLHDLPPRADGKPQSVSIRPILDGVLVIVNRCPIFVDPSDHRSERLAGWEVPGKSCEVHRKALIEDLVPIRYGLIRPPSWLYEGRKEFPHAYTSYLGGCVVRESKRALVGYCPECREAERAAVAAHRDDRN